jgi:starch phosphorylase
MALTSVSLTWTILKSEIAEDAGEDQCFMFGHLTKDVDNVRYNNSYNPTPLEQRSPELAQVFKAIESGMFGDGNVYQPLLQTVCALETRWQQVYEHDNYLVANDFGSFLNAEKLVDDLWSNDPDDWVRKSVLTAFAMGDFSSDRAVQDYADMVSRLRTCWWADMGGRIWACTG